MGLIEVGSYDPEHLSYSTVSTYRDCGTRFYFQKVLGLEQRPGLAAIGGNAFHSCAEEINHLIYAQGIEILDAEAQEDEPPF